MATSGTFTGSRGVPSYGPWLTLEWSRIDVDIAGNRSKLRLELRLHSDQETYFSTSKSGNLEGTSFTYSGGFSGTGTKLLKTKEMWVNHNSDGSRSITLNATFNIDVTWYYPSTSHISSLSVSGTANITDIPRASDFTNFQINESLTDNTANGFTYVLDKKSSDFSHHMTLKFGNTVLDTWTTSSEGTLTRNISAANVNRILNLMPNSTSGSLSLTMQTKSGSSNIGNPKTLKDSFTINTSVAPTASNLSVSIAGSGRDSVIGKFVQAISKVTASFSGTAGYGANVSTRKITVRRASDNANTQTISGASGTTANPVSLSGTYEIIGDIKDSRGRWGSIRTTITVHAYSVPKISRFETDRSNPSSNVVAIINASWSPLGTDNPVDITIVGKDNAGVSTTLYTLNDSTAGSLNTTRTFTSQSDASSYEYTITLADSFGKRAPAVATVGTSFQEVTIAKGKGIGVGKVHERGALDVGGDVAIDGHFLQPSLTKIGSMLMLENAGSLYAAGATQIGTIAIEIGSENIMLDMDIAIFSYTQLINIHVKGYTYMSGSAWHSPKAVVRSESGFIPPVRFATNNGKRYILIGDAGFTWSGYLHVTIPRCTIGYGSSSPVTEFPITLITSLSGYTIDYENKSYTVTNNAIGEELWSGVYYLTENQRIVPTIPIHECPTGWCLVWSDYDADSGTSYNYNWSMTFIHKKLVSYDNGGNVYQMVPSFQDASTTRYVIKQLFVDSTAFVGVAANASPNNGANDVVLRKVHSF